MSKLSITYRSPAKSRELTNPATRRISSPNVKKHNFETEYRTEEDLDDIFNIEEEEEDEERTQVLKKWMVAAETQSTEPKESSDRTFNVYIPRHCFDHQSYDFHDCEIRFKDSEVVIKCHKVFLVQSPVLRAYFKSGFCQVVDNVSVYTVEDSDDEPEIMQILVNCMYNTRELCLKGDQIIPLIKSAEKYGLDSVVESVSKRVWEILTVDSVIEHWILFSGSDTFKFAMEVCENYIIKHMREIIKQEHYMRQTPEELKLFAMKFYPLSPELRNSFFLFLSKTKEDAKRKRDTGNDDVEEEERERKRFKEDMEVVDEMFDAAASMNRSCSSTFNTIEFSEHSTTRKRSTARVTLNSITFVVSQRQGRYFIKMCEQEKNKRIKCFFEMMINDGKTCSTYKCDKESFNDRGKEIGFKYVSLTKKEGLALASTIRMYCD